MHHQRIRDRRGLQSEVLLHGDVVHRGRGDTGPSGGGNLPVSCTREAVQTDDRCLRPVFGLLAVCWRLHRCNRLDVVESQGHPLLQCDYRR